jgi:hypothetical protein
MIDASTLGDAIARHQASDRDGHGCGPECSGAVAALLGIDASHIRDAWLKHWREDPEWRWNEQHFEDTDHRCQATCAVAIVGRLADGS